MEDLRRSWKVPYVVYFCNLFENRLDLVDLRIDEFEEALIDDCGFERNIVIVHLLQRLLKAFVIRSIDLTNFESILLSVLKKYSAEQLFLQAKESNQWSELSMLTKLDIIYTLCEFRLQLGDVEAKITEYEPSDLRIEPIGVDSNGNTLWYFGDLRLYEEKPSAKDRERKKEPEPKTKKKPEPAKKAEAKKPASSSQKQSQSNAKSTPATPSRTPATPVDRPATRSTRSSLALQQTPVAATTPVATTLTPSLNRSTRSRRREEEAAAAAAAVAEVDKSMAAEEEEAAAKVKAEQPPPDTVKDEPTTAAAVAEDEDVKVEVEKDEPVSSEQDEQAKREEEMKREADRQQTELYNELVQQAKDEQAEKAKHRPVIEEKAEYKKELQSWQCVCLSLEDWTKVADAYKASKKKPDQEIAKILEDHYLPEMPALFQKAEKERMHRLLSMAPKRQSQRLQVKQQACQSDSNSAPPALTNGHSAPIQVAPICYAEYSSSDEFDEHRTVSGRRNHHSSSMSSLSSAAMLNDNSGHVSMAHLSEQQRHEEIARQREERLKQRQLRREFNGQDAYLSAPLANEESQASNSSAKQSSDFNIKNYFLMHKVLSKITAWNYSWPFKDAVSEEDAPNYSTIIQNPMDLSTVQLRINSKVYKSRQAFVQDLELIVENCLTYNGEDSFYGKLALKFEHFYKRWLQIFYPREISTSLEEKNRRLMKMLVNRNNPNATGDEDEAENEDEAASGAEGGKAAVDENGEALLTNGGGGGGGGGDENELDMSNSENRALVFDLNGSASAKKKRRRAADPDRDKYIQEPQYVTKRTSSGRLVKMKIITDYDYTSDQEQDAASKKKRRDSDDDGGGVEGIQRKHRKCRQTRVGGDDDGDGDDQLDSSMSGNSASEASGDADSSDDEDFLGNKRKSPKRPRSTPAAPVTRSRGRPVKPMTVSGLLNRAQMNNNNNNNASAVKTFVDDDDDEDVVSGVMRSRYVDSDSDEDLKDLSKFNHTNHLQSLNPDTAAEASNTAARAPLTFEQYVKKLTGSYTLKSTQAGAATEDSGTAAAATVNGFGFYSGPGSISIKVAPAQSSASAVSPSDKAKSSLNIPVVNPALINKVQTTTTTPQKTTTNSLGRMTINEIINSNKQQQQSTTTTSASPNNTVKVITMTSSEANKKYVIINTASTASPVAPAAGGGQSTVTPAPAIAHLSTSSQNNNLIKIINLSQLNGSSSSTTVKQVSSLTTPAPTSSSPGSTTIKPQILTPILNRPIIMINSANGIANLKQPTTQILSAIPVQTTTATSTATVQVAAETVDTPTTTTTTSVVTEPAVEVTPAPGNENGFVGSLVSSMAEAAESASDALLSTSGVLKAASERLNEVINV